MSFFFQLPLVVSYYTKGTPYEEVVKALRDSCEKFGIECHIEGVESKGSWEENCTYKAYFMKEMMQRFQRPLLWVDADAVFLRPLAFDECMFADLAIVQFKEKGDVEFCPSSKGVKLNSSDIASGTVYVNATEGGRRGLDLWCHYSDEIVKEEGALASFIDQISLQLVLFSGALISIAKLPIIYCKIFDKEEEGIALEDIFIEHRQASRRFKTLV